VLQPERTGGKEVKKSFLVTQDTCNYFPLQPKGCETMGGESQQDKGGKTMLRRACEYVVQAAAGQHVS